MYSVYGDTVLDPFWGTGTTTLAAMAAARDSVGYELDPEFVAGFDDRVEDAPGISESVARTRLADHRAFVADARADGGTLGYDAVHYDFPVRTKQERRIRLHAVDDVTRTDDGYRAVHRPVEDDES